jgi:hypothetical protein
MLMGFDMNITKNNRRALSVDTSTSFSDGYVEMTEWSNGDGWDIELDTDNSLGKRITGLTWSELDALHELLNEIYK